MASSADEAAALKRNMVYQTRLRLALKQLDRDKSIRMREINKDTQVFLHRLEESKRRIGLPDLKVSHQPRAASAPVRQKKRKGSAGLVTATSQVSTHYVATKPSYEVINEEQRYRRLSGSRALSASSLCSPMSKTEIPLRDQEIRTPTRTPREITISPRSDNTRKEVRFSFPLDRTRTHGEDCLGTPRSPSPIITKGTALMKINNTVDQPFRRYSAPQFGSK